MGLLIDLVKGCNPLSGQLKTANSAAKMPPASRDTATPVRDPKPTNRSERRRQRVLALLDKSPTARIAVVTDDRAELDAVIVTIAIRGKGTCDVRIPRHKYDGPRLLDLIQKHATTVH